jgi:flavin reductase (DIM6/NTAB) family NADH-FMN oxidoreductase RutF
MIKGDIYMPKIQWKPSAILNPVPVVMVTCADPTGKPNIITIAWTGTVCSDPPMISISVRPERYSHGLISSSGEFVVNLVTRQIVHQADFCGVKSGRDIDKFRETGLTPMAASAVKAPLILESPVNIECSVNRVLHLGSHDLFIARVIGVHVDERLIDARGKLRLDRAGLAIWKIREKMIMSTNGGALLK